MSDFLKLVGSKLKEIRQAKKLNQMEVAERTGKDGFSKSRVSDIERGQTNISLKTLEILMIALDISPNELFNFENSHTTKETENKKLIVDLHKYSLMQRNMEEVKYVVRTTKDFLETVDAKRKAQKNAKN